MVRDILQVTYKDNIQEIDSFDITINNWDADKRAFKYSDSDLFDPGKELELWMGYYGKDRLRLMVKGQITALRPAFPIGRRIDAGHQRPERAAQASHQAGIARLREHEGQRDRAGNRRPARR